MSCLPENELDRLRALIVARFPELVGARCSLLTQGFDSIAVDVEDRMIFKFPRDDEAARRLRKEARLLEVIRPHVTLPVPDLELFEGPPLFSRHAKLTGEHLLAEQYPALPADARDDLARQMARFYASLHALDPATMAAAGAEPLEPWLPPEEILRQAWPVLRPELRALAERTMTAWTQLPPDPLGMTYGFYDGHGWNMAFDHTRQRLNGIYDFADSGFGPLHQEFIHSSFVSTDLTARIVDHYEAITGRTLHRERIHLLTGVFWFSETGGYADNPPFLAPTLRYVESWAAGHG
jgi:aminoglycoside phosphotransferase (APT) family kinase protein